MRDLQSLANVSYEVGRVLRPGGVATMSLRYRLAGPPGGSSTNEWVSVSDEEIEQYVFSAGGLEPVEELRLSMSKATWESNRYSPPHLIEFSLRRFSRSTEGIASRLSTWRCARKPATSPRIGQNRGSHTFSPPLQQPPAAKSFSPEKDEIPKSYGAVAPHPSVS